MCPELLLLFSCNGFLHKNNNFWNGNWWCYGYETRKHIKSRIKERMHSRRKPRPVPRQNGDRVFHPQCWLQQIAEPTGSISACITQRGMEVGLLSNQIHRKNCDVYHYFLRKKFEHYPSLNVLLVLPIVQVFVLPNGPTIKWTSSKNVWNQINSKKNYWP